MKCGRDSLVLKVTDSWMTCLKFQPHAAKDQRVGRGLNLLRFKGPPNGGVCNDEAHFWLNGYVNKQNCRIWSEANPQVYVETPLHPEKTECLELWFQQDGAACHTARVTIDLLKDTFGDRLISRFGPVNWPPKSCDLTLLD
ncbi:uncharacterized protein TNCV_1093781 [Trichonephila clavipes]|uniref:Uncharacterized protein n=1 Tax=Trichonephila clavipes TaxID=2585209 RepID=A0A8X6V3P9_TRICX|nr:uncharacterized protein TNCV_1093781 [Trichonephila clavipes]